MCGVASYHPLSGQFLEDVARQFITAINNVLSDYISTFLKYIEMSVSQIKQEAVLPEKTSEIEHSYNPPRNARFNYFQESGKQIRVGRPFTIEWQ